MRGYGQTWNVGRLEQDELALQSHQRAVAAQDRGFFDDLIVPIDGVTQDRFPRRDTSLEKLAKLNPAFDRTSGQGTLTAGNSSPLTDGAAAIWVASDEGLLACPLRPLAYVWWTSRWPRSISSARDCSWRRCPQFRVCSLDAG